MHCTWNRWLRSPHDRGLLWGSTGYDTRRSWPDSTRRYLPGSRNASHQTIQSSQIRLSDIWLRRHMQKKFPSAGYTPWNFFPHLSDKPTPEGYTYLPHHPSTPCGASGSFCCWQQKSSWTAPWSLPVLPQTCSLPLYHCLKAAHILSWPP